MTYRSDFIKTYDRVPTETELKAYVKIMNLIKSERLITGVRMK